MGEDFAAEVAALCATDVSGRQWQQFLDQHVPRNDDVGKPLDGRSRTLADAKRDRLTQPYRSDPRVAPGAVTAHGLLQAVDTYEHHAGSVRGSCPERNGLKTVKPGIRPTGPDHLADPENTSGKQVCPGLMPEFRSS